MSSIQLGGTFGALTMQNLHTNEQLQRMSPRGTPARRGADASAATSASSSASPSVLGAMPSPLSASPAAVVPSLASPAVKQELNTYVPHSRSLSLAVALTRRRRVVAYRSTEIDQDNDDEMMYYDDEDDELNPKVSGRNLVRRSTKGNWSTEEVRTSTSTSQRAGAVVVDVSRSTGRALAQGRARQQGQELEEDRRAHARSHRRPVPASLAEGAQP